MRLLVHHFELKLPSDSKQLLISYFMSFLIDYLTFMNYFNENK